jgi:hypothetical protein
LQNPQRRLQCEKEVVSFFHKILSTWVPTCTQNILKILRKFWHITIDDINRLKPFGCDIILESWEFHSIYSISIVDPTKLMVKISHGFV